MERVTMKRKLFFSILLVGLFLTSFSQTKVKEVNGVYTTVSTAKAKTPDTNTGKFFVDAKGKKFPVYKSANDKLYYIRISAKTNKPYRVYLKIE